MPDQSLSSQLQAAARTPRPALENAAGVGQRQRDESATQRDNAAGLVQRQPPGAWGPSPTFDQWGPVPLPLRLGTNRVTPQE